MRILLTSVGRRSYLVEYFKEAVGESGKVFVSNSSAQSPAFSVADGHTVTPLIYSDEYIPFLMAYCQENSVNAIVSLFDVDLPILSKNKEKFQEIGVKVVVSDPETLAVCNDKWNTYQFLKKHNIPVPMTFLSVQEAVNAIAEKKIHYPVIVKPRWGMGSISVYQADNEVELNVFYHKVKRDIRKTYLKYESAENIDECVLIQEKLKGQEYGLDVINDLEKNYCTTIVKKKLAMRSGETDCAVTVNDSELVQLGKKLSMHLQHIGNLDVDVFKSDRCAYVLEMNARFGGGYPFSHQAGVDLPRQIVKWLEGKETDNILLTANDDVMSQKDIKLVYIE